MKIRLLAALTGFGFCVVVHGQTYQPPMLTAVSTNTQGTARTVGISFRPGTGTAPTVILYFGGSATFARSAVAAAGVTSVAIMTPIPLNSRERYELQAVEFADASGNTIFLRGDAANRIPGEVRRSFYDAQGLPLTHSVSFTAADMGQSAGERFGGMGRASNLSTRGFVGSGDDAMIVGIVVRNGPKTFLFRAVGPGLAPFGVSGYVTNPQMELRNASGERITGNDDWFRDSYGDNNSLRVSMLGVGAFPLAERDAAFRATLIPGNYTLVITGADGGSGVALAEAYELP